MWLFYSHILLCVVWSLTSLPFLQDFTRGVYKIFKITFQFPWMDKIVQCHIRPLMKSAQSAYCKAETLSPWEK